MRDSSSQYLLALVNDILDMSRIESWKMSANHEPFDIRKVIDRCALITEGLLVRKCASGKACQSGNTVSYSETIFRMRQKKVSVCVRSLTQDYADI